MTFCWLLLPCCEADNHLSTSLVPLQVNLDHLTKAITKENVEHPKHSCFELAQAKIYTLMEKDCYPRFLKSPAYLEVSRKAKTG